MAIPKYSDFQQGDRVEITRTHKDAPFRFGQVVKMSSVTKLIQVEEANDVRKWHKPKTLRPC